MRATHAILLVGIAGLVLALATARVQTTQASVQVRDGVVIHVSHGRDDPQRAVMALDMASAMSGDHDVILYFDLKGIDLTLKDAPDLNYSGSTMSSKAELAALREKGVPMMACPGCLRAAGKNADDLAPGMRIADKNSFFSFTRGRILTLDY